jgi:hypothetical protein
LTAQPTLISRTPPRRMRRRAAVLVLQRVGNLAITEDAQALEVFISGDSALGIYALLNGQATERPMALDVLWQVRRRLVLLMFDRRGARASCRGPCPCVAV